MTHGEISRTVLPLYLQDSDALSVDIDSTLRLCISWAEKPQRRIPLRFISRVVCNKRVSISTDALIACMKMGIPISFVEKNGAPLGWCMGVLRRESSLKSLLVHALDDPDWEHLYGQWLQRANLSTVSQVLLMCNTPATPVAIGSPRSVLFNRHRQKHGRPCGKLFNRLAGLAIDELASRLYREIGEPELLTMARPGYNLLLDLGELVALHAHIDIFHASSLPTETDVGRWATRHYHVHATHWVYRTSALVFDFSQFLRRHWL